MTASDYDADWWLGRSSSREYQLAYDTIAGALHAKGGDVVVEIGCGNGELLRRLHAGRLVGADITTKMLRLARVNLKMHGMEAEIVDALDRKGLAGAKAGNKVLLLHDDYLESRMPSSCADVVVMAFPELERYSYMRMLSRELKRGSWKGNAENAWLERDELLGEYRETESVVELHRLKGIITSSVVRDTEVYRILKKGGTYALADYASIDSPENMLEEQRLLLEARGLGKNFSVVDATFITDAKIADDARIGEEYYKPEFVLKGYSITRFRKR